MSIHLTHHLATLKSLNQGNTTFGPAPHKPVLLLSLLDQLDQQKVITTQIPVGDTLKDLFQSNWQLLVKTGHRCDINNPLYHLQKEGFWTAVKTDGEVLDQARGISKIAYGRVVGDLWEFWQSPDYRALFRAVLLDRYFKDTKAEYLAQNPFPVYVTELAQGVETGFTQDRYGKSTRTVEGYFRSHFFREKVMEVYDSTCCMSMLRTVPNIGIIEACHIQPHTLTGNSHITNGIPLCRNLHRAFDMGLISVNDHYEILVRSEKRFQESVSLYGIRQLAGQRILLPSDKLFYPSLVGFGWHRGRFGF